MVYIVLILPLIMLILLAFYLNGKKLFSRSGHLYLVSFMEGLGTYLIIFALLFEAFIPNPVIKVMIFLIGFAIIVFSNNNINEMKPEVDVQVETFKNLFVIFTSTILLFYVLLSVFRFQPVFLQFLYAFLITLVFNILAYFIKKATSRIFDMIDFKRDFIFSHQMVYTYLVLFAFVFFAIFFNMPKVSMNTAINLNDSKLYFLNQVGSNQLNNRFQSEEILNFNLEDDYDSNLFMNQNNQHIIIHYNQQIIVYDLTQGSISYQGPRLAEISGMVIDFENQELNETRYQRVCDDSDSCLEYVYSFDYGGVSYSNHMPIIMYSGLTYDFSDTAILNNDVLHLFKDEAVDSRFSTKADRPFVGFGETDVMLLDLDLDNYNGELIYLQAKRNDEGMNIRVYQLVEKDIDLALPFYSHYRLGTLVFIVLIGLIPISNYDKHRTIIDYSNKTKEK